MRLYRRHEIRQALAECARLGLTQTQTSVRLKMSASSIHQYCKRFSITLVKRGQIDAVEGRLRAVREQEAKAQRFFGCSVTELNDIKIIPGVVRAYASHRASAKRKGNGFEISLPEWWEIWSASGHWLSRGRGAHNYVMCRKGDAGPYKVGNVFIATSSENIKSYHRDVANHWGVRCEGKRYSARRRINGTPVYLGSFDTEGEARQAFLDAGSAPA